MIIARYVMRHSKPRWCLITLACVRLRLLQSHNRRSFLYRCLYVIALKRYVLQHTTLSNQVFFVTLQITSRNCPMPSTIMDTGNERINLLKVVLAERNRKGKWLAEQLGKNEATVSRWCSNTAQPSLEMLVEIAELLNVDSRQLLNGNNNE